MTANNNGGFMATKKPITQATLNGNGNGNGHTAETRKFTINVQSTGTVSATIRTDSKEEALALLEEFKTIVNPPRKRKPYLHPDDPCLADDCNGFMTVQTGRNRKSGGEYQFLGCSNWPKCDFTAYIAKDESEEDEPTEGS
jgi:hypothetical protein